MRKWHRWISSIAGLFLLFVSATGLLLHADMMVRGVTPTNENPPRPKTTAATLDSGQIGAMMAQAVSRARAERPELPVDHVELSLKKGFLISIGAAGQDQEAIKIDGHTGRILPPPPRKPKSYHYILQDLHAGYYFGWPGRIISLLLGASLVVLGLTGLKLWFDLYKRRKEAGRKGLFWDR
jgi:hypothetical protein